MHLRVEAHTEALTARRPRAAHTQIMRVDPPQQATVGYQLSNE